MMLTFEKELRVYVFTKPCDMRCGFYRLAELVKTTAKANPLSGDLFVFLSRCRRRIKILYWDGDGFCLLYKRIEKGNFRFPKHITEEKYTVTDEEFQWLLHGLHIEEIRYYESLKNRSFQPS